MTRKKQADQKHSPVPGIGDPAPVFRAETTEGEIDFPGDYAGKWVVFFSHPADFTPICTSEFMAIAAMKDRFAKANCELVGLSCDTLPSHVEWLRRIRENIEYKDMKNVEVDFPLIADWKREIAGMYGMIQPHEDAVRAVRAAFIIDPHGIIRLISYYPNNIGRNTDELYRALIALQAAEKFAVYTPANWYPGDDVIDPTASGKAATDHTDEIAKGTTQHDWFFWTKKLSRKKVLDALLSGHSTEN